jgi:chromosome segregation ATPase
MPTQEERLSAVEQAVAALRSDVSDISRNETILLGMAVKHEELLREIRATQAQILARLEAHEQHFAAMDQRFDRLEQKSAEHDRRFDAMDQRFDRLEQKSAEHDRRFDAMDQRFDRLEQKSAEHDRRFDAIDRRFAEHDRRFDRLEAMLTQMLARLEPQ